MNTRSFGKNVKSEVSRKGYSLWNKEDMIFHTNNKQPSDIARQIGKNEDLEYDIYDGYYLFRKLNDKSKHNIFKKCTNNLILFWEEEKKNN